MIDAEFDVRRVDLSSPETNPDDAKVVVINDPIYDFTTAAPAAY